jgi:CHASE2 domain-containing sensor protein
MTSALKSLLLSKSNVVVSQQVILSLGAGDLYNGFPAVTAYLWEANNPHPIKLKGQLPAVPELIELYRSWQLLYEALQDRLDWHPRIELVEVDITNVSRSEFAEQCQRLVEQMNAWLNSEPFRSIDQPLRTHLNQNDEIRFLIETDDRLIQQLPWHVWNFLEHYSKAEIALSASVYQRSFTASTHPPSNKIRILAVFGNSENIDLDQDRKFIEQLSDQAEIKCLVEPQYSQLNDYLWQQWDMLFFAGHSSSQEQGTIQINSTEGLTLEKLRYALRRAIAQGLKLALFNSCDGLGLAQQLADLNIPQIIVMRKPVPDIVAHTFLKHFLQAFSAGQSLYASVRESRERLQGLEGDYPCATWLPMICQNPAVVSTSWQDWRNCDTSQPKHVVPFKRTLGKLLLVSIGMTAVVMGIRWFGLLQPWELSAFDLFMRSRPSEAQDQRLLIVTLTEEDFQLPEQQQRKGSLSDVALTRLLDKLEPYQPRAIGLDIYREPPITAALTQRLRGNDRFFAICKVRDPDSNHPGIAPPPGVPVAQQGFSDVVKDADGVLRRHLLAMQPSLTSPCTAPYALSAQLAFHYLEAEGIVAQYTSDRTLRLGNVVLRRLQSHSGGYQQIDPWGYQILLNYRAHRSSLDIAPTVTLREVLAGNVKPEQIKDRIVLIGVVAQSAHDYLPTPYSAGQRFYQEMPGVIMQAQLLSQLLSAVKDGRALIEPWPIWGDMIWIWGWAGIGGAIALRWQLWRSRILAVGSAIGGLSIVCWLLFLQGTWVPWIPAVLVIIGTSGTIAMSRWSAPGHSLSKEGEQ